MEGISPTPEEMSIKNIGTEGTEKTTVLINDLKKNIEPLIEEELADYPEGVIERPYNDKETLITISLNRKENFKRIRESGLEQADEIAEKFQLDISKPEEIISAMKELDFNKAVELYQRLVVAETLLTTLNPKLAESNLLSTLVATAEKATLIIEERAKEEAEEKTKAKDKYYSRLQQKSISRCIDIGRNAKTSANDFRRFITVGAQSGLDSDVATREKSKTVMSINNSRRGHDLTLLDLFPLFYR